MEKLKIIKLLSRFGTIVNGDDLQSVILEIGYSDFILFFNDNLGAMSCLMD